jgi:hypothetical protein
MLLGGELFDLIERVKSLDVKDLLFYVFSKDEVKQFVIDLNTRNQLFDEGVDSKDEFLGEYAASTLVSKQRRFGSQFPEHITLFEKGDFYKTWSVNVDKNGIITISADGQKEDIDLFEKYGKDVLGLTNDSIQLLIPFIQPFALEYVIKTVCGT